MNRTSDDVNREFKMWMAMTVGLIKDGRMGASQARADRIRAALAYANLKNGYGAHFAGHSAGFAGR